MIYGIERLKQDLVENCFEGVYTLSDPTGINYAVIPNFIIKAGSFAERVIELAIPAPADYPQSFGASIHVKADPVLFEIGNVQNVRNIVASNIGPAWQYWSFRFNLRPSNPTLELISQINEIFKKY